MSRPFKSYGNFNFSKRGAGLIVMVVVFIFWCLKPYTELNCLNNGICTLTKGKEILKEFKKSDIESCQVATTQKRKCYGSKHRRCKYVNYYYPVINLSYGQIIPISVFDSRSQSEIRNFCASLKSNPTFQYKVK